MINTFRLGYMIFRNILEGPFWIAKMAAWAKREDISKEKKYNFLRNMIKTINKRGNVRVRTSGTENLPKEDGYVMFPNHQGYYDSLAIVEAHPSMFGIVLKKEVSDYIFVKQAVALIQGIPIDRTDVKASLEVIRQMTERVKEGGNFLIFPEGTTSRASNNIREMKGGSFKSAVNAKAPIVPVALIDCFVPFNKPGIKKVEVQVHFLKPLYYEDYRDLKTNDIAKIVHDRIENYIRSQTHETIEEKTAEVQGEIG